MLRSDVPQWAISDCITLWRAYVILERPRWLKYIIASVLSLEFGELRLPSMNCDECVRAHTVSYTANYVVYLTLYLYALARPPHFITVLWQTSGGLIGTAPFVSTSAVTATIQIFATSLIAYRAQ